MYRKMRIFLCRKKNSYQKLIASLLYFVSLINNTSTTITSEFDFDVTMSDN